MKWRLLSAVIGSMATTLRSFLLSIALTLAACGGDGTDNAAPAKCEALMTTVCARASACPGSFDNATCLGMLRAGLDCGKAVAVSASYDRCISDTQAATCAALSDGKGNLVLPAACTGAILVSR